MADDEVIVTGHAKKRLRQRVSKNWQKAAQEAYVNGVDGNETVGRFKRYISKLTYGGTAPVTTYKIYHQNIYVFNERTLITVLHVPYQFAKQAKKLTQSRVGHGTK